MAFGDSTLSFAGGAVDSLFSSSLQAEGQHITAEGTRLKAQGNRVEAENYDLASSLSKENEQFTEQSTAVQQTMADRQIYSAEGTLTAGVAANGFSNSGSALDLLASNAEQGALQKQLIGQQGLINEEGYKEQAKSYENLSSYARTAASVEDNIASRQDALADKTKLYGEISGGIKAASAVATLFLPK